MHPILLDFGTIRLGNLEIPLRIGSYGLFFAGGLVVGYLVMKQLGRRYSREANWADFYWPAAIVGFLGAKLANLLVFMPQLISGEKSWIGALQGGGVWLGGVIPAYLYAIYWVRKNRVMFGDVANAYGVVIPVAHGVGRIGCFLGGCCFGAPTDGPLAVTFTSDVAHRLMGTPINTPLHPTQLYEAGAEFFNAGFAYLLWRRGMPQWFLTGVWMSLYGAQRFFIEFLRADPRGSYGPFSTSQWISLGVFGGGVPLLIWAWRKNLPETRAAAATAPAAKKGKKR